jgi:hypothetical protein
LSAALAASNASLVPNCGKLNVCATDLSGRDVQLSGRVSLLTGDRGLNLIQSLQRECELRYASMD